MHTRQCTLILFMLTSLAAAGKSVQWSDRLIPLPKEIRVAGSVMLPGSAIHLENHIHHPSLQTISGLLGAWAVNTGGNAKLTITLRLADDQAVAPEMRRRLADLPNMEQAYTICSDETRKTMTLIGNTPVGLLYAARTLDQLVQAPSNLTANTVLEVPWAEIVDWPDMNERGQWGCSAEKNLDWFSKWKMNLVETSAGPCFDRDCRPTVSLNLDLMKQADALGVKCVPYIMHMDSIMPNCPVLQQARSNPAYKQLLPLLAVQDPIKRQDHSYFGLCLSSRQMLDVLTTWMTSLAQSIQGYHNDLMIWTSESGNTPCWCKDCAGKNMYELEVAAFLQAFDRVKQSYPDLRLRIALSQGSYKSNDKIIALVQGRQDVGLTYYHGGLTYISDHKPMIYPLLEQYARSGRWLGVYPQVTPCWGTVFPWTAPEFIHFRATEFVDKQLSSVSSYSVPDRYYYEFNLMAMAEWLWNSKGRDPAEFTRVYALVTGQKSPDLFVRWAMSAGTAGWTLAESGFNARVGYDPALGFFGVKPFDYRWGGSPGEAVNVSAAIPAAQAALELARMAGDRDMLNESASCLASLQAFELCADIAQIIRGKANDAATRKALAEKLDRLDVCAHLVRANVFDWSDRTESRKPARNMQSRVNSTAVGLLRTCDTLRTVAGRFGIPDPRPDSRIVDILEWSEKDFKKGLAVFTLDVSGLVPHGGGSYHVCFDMGGVARKIEAVLVNPDTGARQPAGTSPETDNDCGGIGLMWGGEYCECRIKIPPAATGEKRELVIHMQATPGGDFLDQGEYAGLIGLRRVWEIGEFPGESQALAGWSGDTQER